MRVFFTFQLLCWVLMATLVSFAQQDKPTAPPPQPGSEYSGMYSFLRDGEFVQLTVEDRVTGFVSRYGDLESDRGSFLDHFFKEAKLDGNKLTFFTETVHGIRFEFRGTIDRGEAKTPADEGYYVLKGTLTEYSTDDAKKTTSKPHAVVLKRFPSDMAAPHEDRK